MLKDKKHKSFVCRINGSYIIKKQLRLFKEYGVIVIVINGYLDLSSLTNCDKDFLKF